MQKGGYSMNYKQILEITNSIISICDKTTSGNVSHNIATIKHQAIYLQENLVETGTITMMATSDQAEYRTKQTPQFVKLTTADYIIEKRMPLGKFYSYDIVNNVFIAIDNTKGEAHTKNFDSELEVLVWFSQDHQIIETEEPNYIINTEMQTR